MAEAPPQAGPLVRVWSLAGLLASAGVLHLVRPAPFESLIPHVLGRPRPWVVGSGLAEIACAAGLAVRPTRRGAALATATLFVAVFPGNVTMALRSRPDARHWSGRPLVGWGRLPLQVPLVAWALRVARDAERASGR